MKNSGCHLAETFKHTCKCEPILQVQQFSTVPQNTRIMATAMETHNIFVKVNKGAFTAILPAKGKLFTSYFQARSQDCEKRILV